MKYITLNRFASLGLIIIVLWSILYASDRINFLSYSTRPALPNFDETMATDLVIDDSQKTISLVQNNGIWYVRQADGMYLADQSRISSLLSSIANLKKEETGIDKSPNFNKFGIGSRKLSVATDKSHFTVYIGNNLNLSRTYLRLNNNSDLLIGTGFDQVFTPEDYRDKSPNLLKDEYLVKKIVINAPNEHIILERDNDNWLANGKQAIKNTVSFYLNDLSMLTGEDVLKYEFPLANPDLSITVEESGTTKHANFYDEGDFYYLNVSGSDQTYKLLKTDVAALIPHNNSFL